MDFIKKQLARLQQQFALLTGSQKMLAVSLVAIMVMTLLWWAKYAGQAEMEEVLPQDFATEDLGRITSQLTSKGIPAKASGSRVLVPADRKIEALSYLSFAQLLPRDTSSAFEEIISKMSSPIDPPSKTDSIHNHAREVMLAQMIRYFPKVRSAMVAIDPNVHRSFDNSILPTATVTIQLVPSEKVDKRLVLAAADAVVGSVAGMERKRVKVIVDGASQPIDDGELGDDSGGSIMDRIRDDETYYSRQVQNQLSYIEGAMVHVTVALNDEHTQTHLRAFDPKGTVKAERASESRTDETTMSTHGAGDLGVNANSGLQVPGPPAAGDQNHTLSDQQKSEFENRIGEKNIWTSRLAGTPIVKSASVSLPRSYFSKIYQQMMGTDKEPTSAVLNPFIDEQLPQFRKKVKGCLPIETEDNVIVTTYTDLMPTTVDATAQASSGVTMLVGGHVKEIALGALALMSLFMVSTMVRKAAPIAKTVGEGELAEGGVNGTGGKGGKGKSEDAAEVGEGQATLDGVEMDSEAIRGQQMVDQVTTLVKENPDAAANLVKRRLNRA